MTDRVDSPWQGKWPTKKNKTLQVTSLKVTYYKFKRKNKTNKKRQKSMVFKIYTVQTQNTR